MDEAPRMPASYRALYEKHLPRAQALPADSVKVSRADPRLARANLRRGIDAITPRLAEVRQALPQVDVNAVFEAQDIARGLIYATTLVTTPVSRREIEQRLAAIAGPREEMLAVAEVLARRGLLPADRVAAIRRGSGKLDTATDGLAVAELFAEHAPTIANKHPFPTEELQKVREDSEWLLEHLQPGGARRTSASNDGSPADVRDRFWTLVAERHKDLRKIGFYLFGEDVDEYVPKLSSRVAGASMEDDEDLEAGPPSAPPGASPPGTDPTSGGPAAPPA